MIPEFDIIEDDDIIYIDFKLDNLYTIAIYNNGDIKCSISNPGLDEKLNNAELQMIFDCVSQANVSFGTLKRTKVWRHIAPVWN